MIKSSKVQQDNEDYPIMVQMSKMTGGDAESITTLFKFNPYNQLSALLIKLEQQAETKFLEK
ncbi:MAG: hypothetical protein RLZZ293_17 [Pseudomonadota bacterium]|jgi:hypothetical protein